MRGYHHGLRAGWVGAVSLLALLAFSAPSQATTVWSGPSIDFSKPPGNASAGKDVILPGVVELSRNFTRGLFNVAVESSYVSAVSPADTEWAFPINNSGQTISAANFANLTFDVWRTAVGSSPPSSVGLPGVLHIVSADIYLDLMFTSWDVGRAGGAGAFSYTRSTPVPEPSTGLLVAGTLGALAVVGRRGAERKRLRSAATGLQ